MKGKLVKFRFSFKSSTS